MPARRAAPAAVACLLWLAGAAYCAWWTAHNPLPDGFQNEYLHVGNAYDLWGALTALDQWHLRWFMYTGYWPWGFYAVPWPFLAVWGPTRGALVAGNLVHLAALLWGVLRLGQRVGRPIAPLLLLAVCPGVFGSLVRFEPNLATIAWTAAGVACLVESQGLRRRRWAVGWGLCLGLGLMFDRLTVGFFLGPAVLPLLAQADRRAWRNTAWAAFTTLFCTLAYYREFFLRHTDELLGQAPVGEIDSAGVLHETGATFPAAYYPLALLDSQAGAVVGAVMLAGLGVAAVSWGRTLHREGRRAAADPRAPMLFAVVPALLLFTFIAKKQVFYTLPVLGPLAVLAALSLGRGTALAAVAGLHGIAAVGLGWLEPGLPSGPFLPGHLVAPRHAVALPPSHQAWPLDALAATLAEHTENNHIDSILVMSESQRLFEGYLALAVRERTPQGTAVRGVITDPHGTYELLDQQDLFVWAAPAPGVWPTQAAIERELVADHYTLADLPPVVDHVVEAAEDFEEVARLSVADAEDPTQLVVFRRRPVKAAPETR